MHKVYDFRERLGSNHKVAGAQEIVDDALARGVDTISVISSGNLIGAVIKEVNKRKLEEKLAVVNIVNHTVAQPYKSLEVRIEPGLILETPEQRATYVHEQLPGAGTVVDYTDFVSKGLHVRAREILADKPDVVALPVGSGKLFTVLAEEIAAQGLETRLHGFVPRGENGFFNDENLFRDEAGALRYKRFTPTSPADKLVAPYTSFKQSVLASVAQGHALHELDAQDIVRAHIRSRAEGVTAEISAAVGFAALDEPERYGISSDALLTIVSTGVGDAYLREYVPSSWIKRLAAAVVLSTSTLIGAAVTKDTAPQLYTEARGDLTYADLNGDGVVAAAERESVNTMVGASYTITRRVDGTESMDYSPRYDLPKSTLRKMRALRDELQKDVEEKRRDTQKRYGATFRTSLDALSFNELRFEYAQLDAGMNPELFTSALAQRRLEYERHLDMKKQLEARERT